MNFNDSIRIANWLEDNYSKYLSYLSEGGTPAVYKGDRSGDWETDNIRVSKVAKNCPRYDAMESLGNIDKREYTPQELAKFDDATRIAQGVYESIAWACQSTKTITMETEYRVEGNHWSGLVGTTDVVLHTNTQNIPIEVKRTDADKWWSTSPRGITYDQFLQIVGEMVLLSYEKYEDSRYGFLFTRYGSDSDPLLKVWTIKNNSQGWELFYKEELCRSYDESDWPTDSDGYIYLSYIQYEELVDKYDMYRNMEDPMEGEAPYEIFTNWRCCKVVKADYYALEGKYKGAKKPKTGIAIPRCPLFTSCFSGQIEKAGYDNIIPEESYDLERFE